MSGNEIVINYLKVKFVGVLFFFLSLNFCFVYFQNKVVNSNVLQWQTERNDNNNTTMKCISMNPRGTLCMFYRVNRFDGISFVRFVLIPGLTFFLSCKQSITKEAIFFKVFFALPPFEVVNGLNLERKKKFQSRALQTKFN